MKHNALLTAALASVGLLSTALSDAAVIIEPNGKASGNYSAGTATGNSTTAGSPTLQAPGLTFEAASVFGGEPYTYTYSPGSLANNTAFGAATVLNSPANIFATGLAASPAGIYKVYHVFPQTGNSSGQPTLYNIQLNGGSSGVSMIMSSQDQNVNDLTTGFSNGQGIGLWELVGQVTVLDPSDTITLTVSTTSSGSVGARTAGVLFDYVGPIPEPSSTLLLGLSAFALVVRRRR